MLFSESLSYKAKSRRTHKNLGNEIIVYCFYINYFARLMIRPRSLIEFSSIFPIELKINYEANNNAIKKILKQF